MAVLILPACSNEDGSAEAPAPSARSEVFALGSGEPKILTNDSDETHTISAADGTFDSGPIEPHGTWSWDKPKRGEHPVFCKIHWDRLEEEGIIQVTGALTAADADAELRAGLDSLGTNPSSAIDHFQEVLSILDLPPDASFRDQARAGIALSRLHGSIAAIGSFLSVSGRGTVRASPDSGQGRSHDEARAAPPRKASSDAVIRTLIEPFLSGVSDARRRLASIQNPETFVLEVPRPNVAIESLPSSIDLSGRWTELEIRLFSALSATVDAVSAIVLSHDLSIDLGDESLASLDDLGLKTADEIRAVRRLGGLFERNSDALTLSDPSRFLAGRQYFIRAVDALLKPERDRLPSLLRGSLTPANAEVRQIAIEDSNASGKLDAGDTLQLPLVGPVVLSEGLIVLIDRIPDLLEKLRSSLQSNSTEYIEMSDLNAFLGFLGYTAFPNMAAIRIGAWFDQPKPLREILPITVEIDGRPEWMIEGEISAANPIVPDGTIIRAGDGTHFNGTDASIPADLIAPRDDDDKETIPYFALRDPTLGGMLFTNLNAFDVPVGADPSPCAKDSKGFCPASVFSFNAIAAYFDAVADF